MFIHAQECDWVHYCFNLVRHCALLFGHVSAFSLCAKVHIMLILFVLPFTFYGDLSSSILFCLFKHVSVEIEFFKPDLMCAFRMPKCLRFDRDLQWTVWADIFDSQWTVFVFCCVELMFQY